MNDKADIAIPLLIASEHLLRVARGMESNQVYLIIDAIDREVLLTYGNEDYDYSLMNNINDVVHAIGEVHSIAYMDPIDTAIYRAAFDFIEGRMKMSQCLEDIEHHLKRLYKGPGMKNRR